MNSYLQSLESSCTEQQVGQKSKVLVLHTGDVFQFKHRLLGLNGFEWEL